VDKPKGLGGKSYRTSWLLLLAEVFKFDCFNPDVIHTRRNGPEILIHSIAILSLTRERMKKIVQERIKK